MLAKETSTLNHTMRLLTPLRKKHFENIVGNGQNAGNKHFLPFPQCFLPSERHNALSKIFDARYLLIQWPISNLRIVFRLSI